jgi:predicted metal-binding membrane protein
MAASKSYPAPRGRNLLLGILLLLAAAAWIVLIRQATMASDAAMGQNALTMGLNAPLFLLIWIVMMVAMMFPTAAPMILTFHQIQAGKRRHGERFVSTSVFVGAYLLVWALAGILAYGGAVLAEALAAKAGLSPTAAARIGGAVLVFAGLYQLTPLKDRCLAKCRTPMGFIITNWRDGTRGALGMGFLHGVYCLGCCWVLFVILFPLGIMNIAAMAVLTLVIFAEKSLPWSRAVPRLTAAALVAYGAVVIAAPRYLPTFAQGAAMEMPGGGAMPMQMDMPEMSKSPAQR